MTTRRFRFPGPPPPLGLIGLPPGISEPSSVEPRERGVDADGSTGHTVERAAGRCALEARESVARVAPPPRALARHEQAVLRMEALELALRRLAAAPGARPDRVTRRGRPRA